MELESVIEAERPGLIVIQLLASLLYSFFLVTLKL